MEQFVFIVVSAICRRIGSRRPSRSNPGHGKTQENGGLQLLVGLARKKFVYYRCRSSPLSWQGRALKRKLQRRARKLTANICKESTIGVFIRILKFERWANSILLAEGHGQTKKNFGSVLISGARLCEPQHVVLQNQPAAGHRPALHF